MADSHIGAIFAQGVDCSADLHYTTTTMPVMDGYWRTSTSSYKVRLCHNTLACLGDECRDGHEGAYCSKCIENYHCKSGE